jgi:hypothetical protein
LKGNNSKRKGVGLIDDFCVTLRELGMMNKKERDMLARWFYKIYTAKQAPGLKVLEPVATKLSVKLPTGAEGRGVREGKRDILRDRLMLGSCM